jgi:hypothetical protein
MRRLGTLRADSHNFLQHSSGKDFAQRSHRAQFCRLSDGAAHRLVIGNQKMKPVLRMAIGLLSLAGLDASTGVRVASAQPPMEEGAQYTVFYGRNRDFPSIVDLMATDLSAAEVRDVRGGTGPPKQWTAGVNAAGPIGGFVLGFTELLYGDFGESGVSGLAGMFVPPPRVNIAVRPRLFEWTGGMHMQVPMRTWRLRPYFGGGAGVMHTRTRVTILDTNGSFKRTDFLYHFDAGVRVFINRRVGVSSEFRAVQIPDRRWYRFFVGPVIRFE